MQLGLKTEQMNAFFREMAGEAHFDCMLWGVANHLANAFCYIGCTRDCLYVVAVLNINTAEAIQRCTVPFSAITKVKVKKAMLGNTRTIEIDAAVIDPGDEEDPEDLEIPVWLRLQVKETTIGTDIKDQKENAERFYEILERLSAKL